jgi:hypothetical protein
MLIDKGKLYESIGHKAIGPHPEILSERQPVAETKDFV